MSGAVKLTEAQSEALRLLAEYEGPEPSECYAFTCTETHVSDRIVGVHWRTADSLESKGLIRTEYVGPEEGSDVWLTAFGRAVLSERAER